jgi:hypothetical protein
VTYSLTLPRVSAEGFWLSESTSGTIVGVVLENGENWFFSFSNTINAASNTINAAWQGLGISSTGKYIASNEVIFNIGLLVGAPTLPAPFSGEYVALKTLNGSIAIQNQSAVTFSANYDSAYERPASLTDIVGAWKAPFIDLTVGANGALTFVSEGCTSSGSISPRPSGKNVYNVKLTVGGSPCANRGLVVEGIGFLVTDAASTKNLIIGALDSTRTFEKSILGSFKR